LKKETIYCDWCVKEIEETVYNITLQLPGANYREYDLCECCLNNLKSSLKEGRPTIKTSPMPYIPTYPQPDPYPFKPWITWTSSDTFGGGTIQ
jgi:hypothetical protein